MPDRSLDQQRAAFAWERISSEFTGGESIKEYRNLAKGAPALVMSNGLMQVLAFYEGKGKNHHRKLAAHLCAWLADRLGGRSTGNGSYPRPPHESHPGFRETIDALASSSSAFYLEATQEALEFLKWVRQIADAIAADEGE